MSYWFSVKTKDKIYKFIPTEFKDNNKERDLADYDYYTLEHRKDLKEIISKKYNIDLNKIEKITIDYTRNKDTKDNNPYSSILGNTELEELLEKENGKFKHLTMGRRKYYNKGKNDLRVIYAIDPILLKMRSYILNDLEKFSTEVYTSDGEMGKIIRRYNEVMKSGSDNSYIEREFYDHFTEYRNFRSISMAKYRYDRKVRIPNITTKEDNSMPISNRPVSLNGSIGISEENTDYYNGGLEQFNYENEEFLEQEEFDQMINYDDHKEKRI